MNDKESVERKNPVVGIRALIKGLSTPIEAISKSIVK